MRHDFSVFDGDMIISKANITLSGCSSGRVCLTPQILTRVDFGWRCVASQCADSNETETRII